ncbi:linker for activation of T-cells family member 2 isoform X2 [Trachypithecus francoisi]|uniref:linker for activation of T-cells family member 2 isoform X2 n=1 Tax=Trachypithecus francoisi TaxID=54180 RepID=UPI00141AE7CA|nr:linker for activation of T-cells family member 2 isoform X2 [Trachypithecus francoisi]
MIQWLAGSPPCPPASVSGVGISSGSCAGSGWDGRSEEPWTLRRENQQSFTGSWTYSLVGQAWPGPLDDTAPTRKDKLLQFSPGLEDPASSRYQNFSKGSRHGSEEGYIDPIAMEYYNWGRFRKPPEDDANSYENVLICKQKTTEPVAQQDSTGGLCRGDHIPSSALKTGSTSGLCPSASPEEDEESEDYQNSASIHQWRESRRVMGQLQRQPSPGPVGSPDEEDGEPDYVNGEVSATEA